MNIKRVVPKIEEHVPEVAAQYADHHSIFCRNRANGTRGILIKSQSLSRSKRPYNILFESGLESPYFRTLDELIIAYNGTDFFQVL